MLPNFLLIGAQKSGTTTLLRQLGRHPDIFMAPARETRFFLYDHLYSQGAAAYEIEYFQDWNGETAVGEKTPEYLCEPTVPARVAATLGADVKLIVSFRSPAQRAYAHYRHNFQHLWETLGFEDALQREEVRCSAGKYQRLRYGYLWRGRYAEQMARYLETFSTAVFCFIVYEQDIVLRQAQALERVFGFLGVARDFKTGGEVSAGRAVALVPEFIESGTSLASRGSKTHAEAGDILLTREGISPRHIKRPSESLMSVCRAAYQHLPQFNVLPRERELEINRRYFTGDIRRLEKIIGRDLGDWLD